MVWLGLAGLGCVFIVYGIVNISLPGMTILRFRGDDNEASESAKNYKKLWGVGLILLGLFVIYLGFQG